MQKRRHIIRYMNLLREGRELLAEGDTAFTDAVIDREAMQILLFTSGTTDVSKAVMLSHKNICENLMAMSSMVYIDDKDIFLSILPIHHTYECTCGFLCPVYRGSTVAYCEGLRHITKNMAEGKITMMLVVPLVLESMHRRVWDTIRKQGLAGKVKFALRLNSVLVKSAWIALKSCLQRSMKALEAICACLFPALRQSILR